MRSLLPAPVYKALQPDLQLHEFKHKLNNIVKLCEYIKFPILLIDLHFD